VLGYWIGEQYWGKGYGTEATKALLDFAFNNLRISKITGEHLSSNPVSGKVMKYAGMSYIWNNKKGMSYWRNWRYRNI